MATETLEDLLQRMEPALAADLLRLRSYLEQEDIEGARTFVKELAQKWPDSDRVQHYACVLAPAEAWTSSRGTGRRMDREHAWLRAHGHEYPGQWLAIYGDRLIAHGPELRPVRTAIREAIGDEIALLFYQSPEEEPS